MITGVNAVRTNGVSMSNFESKTAVDSSPYFVLKSAGNGMTLGKSETYSSVAAKDNGIAAVIAAVSLKPAIEQVDLTANENDGQFELFTDVKLETRFRLRAPNGEIIAASEGYTSKSGALNGIAAVRENAPTYSRFVLKDPSNDDQYWFVLRGANNEIVAVSEMYKTAGARANGVYAVQRVAPGARLLDYTVAPVPAAAAVPKLEIYQQGYGTFGFQLRDAQGRVLFTSYAYRDFAAAKAAATAFKADAAKLAPLATAYGAVVPTYGSALLSGYDAAAFTAAVRTALATATVAGSPPPAARLGRFHMFCGKTTGVYFNLKAANNEILIQSEKYNSRASAQKGIASVKANVQLPAKDDDATVPAAFKLLTSRDAKPYYTVVATNGKTIGVSETFNSDAARDNGIWSVTRNAPNGPVVDEAFGCKFKDEPRYPAGFEYSVVNKVYREEEEAAEAALTATVAASASTNTAITVIATIMLALMI